MTAPASAYRTSTEAIASSDFRPRNDGVECEAWAGLVLLPRRKRRERVTIWRHPDVWPVEDCSRRPQTCSGVLDGPVCSVLPRGRATEWPPVIWRIGGAGSHTYCDGDLPERYRALVQGFPVLQRYVHPHDRPCARAAPGGGWEARPACICGDPDYGRRTP
jgi:hypothetical protein